MANAGEVVVGISASIDGIQSALDTAKQQIKQFANDAQAAGKSASMPGVEDGLKRVGDGARGAGKATQQFGADTQKGANDATMAFVAVAAAAKTAFDGIKNAVNDGIAAAQAYQAAMIGLNSVAQGRGIGAEAIQTETTKVVDAFFSAADAATAYKNLLTRGYSLEQATDTITRLKDAAAFGRQASMGFAQSIVSATEGLRNENSILVDNAGVTKNVVKMWQDYAKARGLATTEMTQAQKVEAEYLGIMQETALQTGDFQKMTKTLAGDQANAAQQSLLAAQSFGEAMTPMVSAGEQIKAGVLGTLKELTTTFPEVTAGATAAAGAFTLLVGAVAAFKAASKLSGDIGMATSILSPLGKVAAVLGVIAAIYTKIKQAQEEAAKAEEERKQAVYDNAEKSKQSLSDLQSLLARYRELSDKATRTVSENTELADIIETLSSQYGLMAGNIGKAADEQERFNRAAAALTEQQKEQARTDISAAATEDLKAANDSAQMYAQMLNDIADADNRRAQTSDISVTKISANNQTEVAGLQASAANADAWSKAWTEAYSKVEAASGGADFTIGDVLDEMKNLAREGLAAANPDWINFGSKLVDFAMVGIGDGLNSDTAQGVKDSLANLLNGALAEQDPTKTEQGIRDYVNTIMTALQDPTMIQAAETLQKAVVDAENGIMPDTEAVTEAWNTLYGDDGTVIGALTAFGEALGLTKAKATDFAEKMAQSIYGLEGLGDTATSAVESLTAANYKGTDGFDYLNASAKDWNTQQKKLIDQSTNLSNAYNEATRKLSVYEKGMAAVQKAQKSGTKLTQDDQDALSALRKEVNYSGDDLNMLAQLTRNAAAKTKGNMEGMSDAAVNLQTDFGNLQASANVRGDVQVDTSAAAAALSGLAVIAAGLLALLSALGVVSGETSAPKPSGGGGGKKDDEEDAKRKAEQARKDAIEADYRAIEHRRTMNEISFEEELAQLEELRRKHRLNAEEMMDWEEKVHEVQQEIRDRDTDSVDTLTEGIISALQNRYESMRDAELARLDESRKAWEDWKDSNVASIQAQIDALDDLTESEDRETQKAEKLRKVASLKEQLTYEQDAYNRAKLQQQLDAAQKAYDDLVTKYDRADQKKALQDQITAVENQADSELDAIDQQEDAINAAYDERLKAASLQAEAEKVLMSNTQQQIIDLIAAYAPDYNATGQNLGEQLYQGFLGRVGNIANWFASFNASIDQLQDAAASAVTSATGSFYAEHNGQTQTAAPPTVVYQTVNYNQPAETPSQTARRLAEANEALAQEIASVL